MQVSLGGEFDLTTSRAGLFASPAPARLNIHCLPFLVRGASQLVVGYAREGKIDLRPITFQASLHTEMAAEDEI